jgi:hypothetical protein
MKIKKIAVLAGMGLAFSGAAQAADLIYLDPDFDKNTHTEQTYYAGPLAADTVYAGSVGVNGLFEHKWTFDIPYTLSTGGSVISTPLSMLNITVLDIVGLDASLHFANGDLIEGVTCSGGSCSGSGTFLPDTDHSPDYYFLIKGNGTGASGGQYTFTMVTAPVPEAETWAMMLAGLGLVGLQLRRKGKVAKEIAVN